MLNRRPKIDADISVGSQMLLRLSVDWLPDPDDERAKEKPFILTNSDLKFQNAIVLENS